MSLSSRCGLVEQQNGCYIVLLFTAAVREESSSKACEQ